MPVFRLMTTFQDISNLPEDRYVNTFYVNRPSLPSETDLSDMAEIVRQFYMSDNGGGSTPITGFMSGQINGGGHSVKIYNMGDPKPRPPLLTYGFTIGAGGGAGGQNLPAEVACCLTFHAAPVPGVRPQSTRGRIYIGPLFINALSPASAGASSRPGLELRGAIISAAQRMQTAFVAEGCQWSIGSGVQGKAYPVTTITVDDAWDTQRRRGCDPTQATAVQLTTQPSGVLNQVVDFNE